MIIKAFNLTLGVLVAFSVWCYAIAFLYAAIRAALAFYHLLPT